MLFHAIVYAFLYGHTAEMKPIYLPLNAMERDNFRTLVSEPA
jgi:hypothetical protein